MAAPVKTETVRPPDGHASLERDTRIEDLLLAGLDHYFAGEHELAINVWTRVLFFDRAHARARAYIERARSALAERQRESDELLHQGMAAFHRGEGGAARDLLTSAIERGGNQDVAQAFLDRLDRLQGTPAPSDASWSSEPARQRPEAMPQGEAPIRLRKRPVRVWPLLALALLSGAAMFGAASRDLLEPLLRIDWIWRQPPAAQVAPTRDEPLPVPRAAELSLGKARAFFAVGRLPDGLRALDAVRPADPVFPEAERLRAQIQQALMQSARPDTDQGAPTPAAIPVR